MVYPLEMWLMKTAFKIAHVILVPVSRYKLDWNILGGCLSLFVLRNVKWKLKDTSTLQIKMCRLYGKVRVLLRARLMKDESYFSPYK